MPTQYGRRKSGQVVQPGIQYEPEGNGWPDPLVDPSNPLKYKYTDGKNGRIETKDVTNVQATTTPVSNPE